MRIKRYVTLAIVIIAIGTIFPPSADARGRHHGGWHGHHHGHGHYSGSSVSFGVGLGLGFLFSPYTYGYPYYAPAPVYVVPSPQPQTRVITRQTSHTVSQEKSAYCREYTKNILVDGKEQKAYGTACLQDDGSWRIMN